MAAVQSALGGVRGVPAGCLCLVLLLDSLLLLEVSGKGAPLDPARWEQQPSAVPGKGRASCQFSERDGPLPSWNLRLSLAACLLPPPAVQSWQKGSLGLAGSDEVRAPFFSLLCPSHSFPLLWHCLTHAIRQFHLKLGNVNILMGAACFIVPSACSCWKIWAGKLDVQIVIALQCSCAREVKK